MARMGQMPSEPSPWGFDSENGASETGVLGLKGSRLEVLDPSLLLCTVHLRVFPSLPGEAGIQVETAS